MSILLLGIALIVSLMLAVIGVPLVVYLKRDLQWDDSRDKSFDKWYRL